MLSSPIVLITHAQFVALVNIICTFEQASDISIFRIVFVPKELLNQVQFFAVVMNLIMYEL